MKKILLLILTLFLIAACDSTYYKKHMKSYKIYFEPYKEMNNCRRMQGLLMIENNYALGQLDFKECKVARFSGTYKKEDEEIKANFYDVNGSVVGTIAGKLESAGGKGSWITPCCEGNWVAVREQ